MTDRVASIRIRADISDLTAKLAAGGRAVQGFANQATAADVKSRKWRDGLDTVASAAGKVGIVAGVAFAGAVMSAANFDAAMSNVQAATHETAGNMDLLRDAALEAGKRTVFSATEAAGAIEAMAKAGVSTQDILAGGLNGALDLAAAGSIEVGQAAEIAATALNQFGLAGEDIPHVADVLAAAAGKAQGEVTDMAEALKYVGPVAAQMGVSIEETTGAIAELASQGILGSEAGTGLRGMLMSLTSPSKLAATEMERLGISMYDAQGNFVGFEGMAGQLQSALGDLTKAERDNALGRIFGNQQVTAARILYAGGAADVAKWTAAVDDQGFAAETAATKLDNLKGDVEQLGGALETALIGVGSGQQGALRGLTQGATSAVNAFAGLPPSIQSATGAALALTAVTGGGLWFGAKVVQGITQTRTALDQLGFSGSRAEGALRGVSRAAAAVGVAFAGLAIADALSGVGSEALPGINAMTASLGELRASAGAELPKQFDDLGAAIDRVANPNRAQALQDSIAGVIGFGGGDEVKNFRAEVASLDAALANLATTQGAEVAAEAFIKLGESAGLTTTQMRDLGTLLPQYKDALAGAASAGGTAASSAEKQAAAQQKLADATAEATQQMRDQRSEALRAMNAQINYEAALDDAAAAIKANGRNLDITTAKGRANMTALLGVAAAWNDMGDAMKTAGSRRQAINNFVDLASAMGMSAAQARRLAERIFEIPDRKPKVTPELGDTGKVEGGMSKVSRARQAKVLAQVDGADRADGLLNYTARERRALITANAVTFAAEAAINAIARSRVVTLFTRTVKGSAAGGPVYGPGTATSDSIPAMLSHGEYVIRAAAASKYGMGFLDQINAMRYAQGGSVHTHARSYAQGGAVSGSSGTRVLVQGHVSGTISTPWGEAPIEGVMREVARDEIDAHADFLARGVPR